MKNGTQIVQRIGSGTTGTDTIEVSSFREVLGGFGVGRKSTTEELLRDSLSGWVANMHPTDFGTLTLRTIHGKGCSTDRCNGYSISGTSECRVPGMSRTDDLVKGWLRLVESAVVVEEYGKKYGRRHFHFLGSGISKVRSGEQPCLRCVAGFRHTDHFLTGNSNKFWETLAGSVDQTKVMSQERVVAYLLKAINYGTKEVFRNDNDEHASAVDDGKSVTGRFWVKRCGEWLCDGYGHADAGSYARHVRGRCGADIGRCEHTGTSAWDRLRWDGTVPTVTPYLAQCASILESYDSGNVDGDRPDPVEASR